jgi:acyl-CoA dehydrogenase
METVAKLMSREWLDWPFFEPRHRTVCEALDRFVMWGSLDAIDHGDVDGACRKLSCGRWVPRGCSIARWPLQMVM